ncbi:unnamed protein product [Natator depressus]
MQPGAGAGGLRLLTNGLKLAGAGLKMGSLCHCVDTNRFNAKEAECPAGLSASGTHRSEAWQALAPFPNEPGNRSASSQPERVPVMGTSILHQPARTSPVGRLHPLGAFLCAVKDSIQRLLLPSPVGNSAAPSTWSGSGPGPKADWLKCCVSSLRTQLGGFRHKRAKLTSTRSGWSVTSLPLSKALIPVSMDVDGKTPFGFSWRKIWYVQLLGALSRTDGPGCNRTRLAPAGVRSRVSRALDELRSD